MSSAAPTQTGSAAPAGGQTAASRAAAALPVDPASVMLPLRFVVTGVACLVFGTAVLLACPELLTSYHYNQRVIAVTHLFTLGWICSIVMGAMYQLVPVALETKLHSERLGRWHFVLHLVGVAGMVSMFWIWNMKQVGNFGSVFGIGVLLFTYNIARTLARIRRWNVVALAIASALFWLVATMLAGLYLAATKCWPLNYFAPLAQMHAHAHLGVVGFFLMMTVGVSYKLMPMFTLSEVQNPRRAMASVLCLNIGLAGAFGSILVQSRWKLGFGVILLLALALYGLELMAILRARKRRGLDWGLRYFLTAVSLVVPAAAFGLILAWPGVALTALTGQLENVYGFVALLGIVSFAILGMLYKIVPFLVWYASYSREIGRKKVPSLAELYSTPVQIAGYWAFLGGIVVTSISIVVAHEGAVRCGCALLACSLLLFVLNMARICSHLLKPQTESLPLRAVPNPATLML